MGRFLFGILVAILLGMNVGEAAPQVITASGVYIMGDNDSPKIAKAAARQEAMRSAVEQAGVYVESYSKTQNMQLTTDDIKVISGAVLKVTNEKAVPELVNGVWKYTVTLTAEVDTDQIDLKFMMDKRTELEKLQKERDELKKQNEELLAKYQKATGKEKSELGTELESQYSLGKIFDHCVALIQRGERQAAVTELSRVIRDEKVTDSPLAYAYYLRGRAYYELNSDTMAMDDFHEALRTAHDNSIYPIWRAHYYRGLIYYDWRKWQDSYDELKQAWDASDQKDYEMWEALQRAEARLHPRTSQSGIDWTKILGEVIAGTLGQNSHHEDSYGPEADGHAADHHPDRQADQGNWPERR